jgi:uncharacterized membrane protein YedE/YeeE
MHISEGINITNGLIGGLILGASVSIFVFTTGKIPGVSGISEKLVIRQATYDHDQEWNWSYVAGLISSGIFLSHFRPDSFGPEVEPVSLTMPALVVAGVLTGLGARMGQGCTSGHGLCGLSRLSPRSFAAVLTFMGTGALSAGLSRSDMLRDFIYIQSSKAKLNHDQLAFLAAPTATVLLGTSLYYNIDSISAYFSKNKSNKKEIVSSTLSMHIVSFSSAVLFGLGLGYSGMCDANKVLNFLDFSGRNGWDPSLMGVMAAGVTMNLMTFHALAHFNVSSLLDATKKLGSSLKMRLHPDNQVINTRLLLGSALFGLGWGLGGICPGPAFVSLGATTTTGIEYFIHSMLAGMILNDHLFGSAK